MQDGFSGRPAPSRRGGFPEPFLAQDPAAADCRRRQCLEDLIREDVVEFSRIGEIRAMRLFVEMLRERVGSPLSLASIARDLQVSPTTVAKYLDILEALYSDFSVRPYPAADFWRRLRYPVRLSTMSLQRSLKPSGGGFLGSRRYNVDDGYHRRFPNYARCAARSASRQACETDAGG